ncbi:MAG: TIGR03032 family protein [Bacteroidota bacterium]
MSEKPFFYYSQAFIKLLHKLNITLVFSTYQAGKLIFVSSPTGEAIYKYAKNFKRPMGIAVDGNKLAVASRNFIEIFSRSDKLGKTFPSKPNFYDNLFIPQVKYFTGITDMHEITFNEGEIYAVNTSFSCVTQMSETHHFVPVWQPDFISSLEPEDRCHLNGLIMKDGNPEFATFFDKSNENNGWRKTPIDSGVLYDCQKQEAILDGLSMPHSPTRHGDLIFFLQSATGEVMQYNLKTKELTRIIQLNSFLRGMAIYGDYLFIGASKMRETSKTFKDLPIAKTSYAGIEIVNYKTKRRIGGLNYTANISEIFEVQVIENMSKPIMLTENDEGYEKCINCGDDLNYWLIEEDEK